MQETTSSLAIVEPSASKQSALLRVDEPNLNSECPEDCTQTGGFSIKHLPFELRCLIYADYLATNPSIPITSLNAALPLHQTHSIYSSSPYFQGAEVPSSFYHAHQTFTFTSGITMRQFSELFDRQREVKRIRIICKLMRMMISSIPEQSALTPQTHSEFPSGQGIPRIST